MIIILKHIPANTLRKDIEDFVKPALNGGFLRKSGRIERISMLVQKAPGMSGFEHHALVDITPEPIARKAITKLNCTRLKNKNIGVNEYQTRLWHNDPRINREPVEEMLNKRKGDRRRRNLEVEQSNSTLFSGDKSFHKKLD
ncbi:MAG: RNA-binding protein [Methylobacter sp.]|nr:RNA-binding protein [Methylobacter sp.]